MVGWASAQEEIAMFTFALYACIVLMFVALAVVLAHGVWETVTSETDDPAV